MAGDPRKVNVYLTDDDQKDLALVAFSLTRAGADGLVDKKGTINRSAVIQTLIHSEIGRMSAQEQSSAQFDLDSAQKDVYG